MGAVAERFSDLVVVTSDNPRKENPEEIIRQILAGLQNPSKALVIPDRKKAIELGIQHAQVGDIVLIAGKGHEQQQILATHVIEFDDRKIAQSFLV